MMQGLTGWSFILVFYVVIVVVLAAALYLVIRLAVLHALKAHTRWLDQRVGDGPAQPPA